MFVTVKTRVIAGASALTLVVGLVLTINITSTVIAARNFNSALVSGNDLPQKASNLSNKVSSTLGLLASPGLKQILARFGLDFTNIAPEITAMISASPSVLGFAKPKRYMIAFQNSAEARGTGGLIGAYAIIQLNKGKLTVEKTGSMVGITSLSELPIFISDEYLRLYGNNPAIWQNSNLSPHFPYGARMWMALWKNHSGETLDGLIAVDPSALSYILKATGDLTLKSGEIISSENLIENTLSTAYQKYKKDNMARKQYLVEIMNSAFAKILLNQFSKFKFIQGLQRGIIEHRILFYSTDADTDALIAPTRLSGSLLIDAENQYRVVIQNIDASKLDYYLKRDVTISSLTCDKLRKTELRVTVTNTLDQVVAKELPDYVLTRADKGKPASLKTGQHRFKVFIYGPIGATILSASRSNQKGEPAGGSAELGRPIVVTDLDLAPGESEDLLAKFIGGTGKITFSDQPLVIPTKVSIKDKC